MNIYTHFIYIKYYIHIMHTRTHTIYIYSFVTQPNEVMRNSITYVVILLLLRNSYFLYFYKFLNIIHRIFKITMGFLQEQQATLFLGRAQRYFTLIKDRCAREQLFDPKQRYYTLIQSKLLSTYLCVILYISNC